MTPLEIRPVDGIGARVVGVDLTATTVGEWNQIEAAFAAFGLLIFPDQVMSNDDRDRFADRWGQHLNDTQPDAPGWSADRSFAQAPTAASLISHDLPGEVATITVSSMYAAFDALSSGTQIALEALEARHRRGDEAAVHPLVIRHPVSGRKVMYLNPAFTSSVVDMEEAAGLALLNELFAHALLEEFVTEVTLAPGTVVLLDHRAILLFSDPATNLSMRRIGGGPLAPAFRQPKPDPSFTQRAGATLAGGIITAAMTGIADVLQPEKRSQDIEIVSEAPEREPLSNELDFGDLPPLD